MMKKCNSYLRKLVSLVIALGVVLYSTAPGIMASTTQFKDVQLNDWYANDIYLLTSLGIIDGFEDQTFRPDEPVTRAQAAKIFSNAIHLKSIHQTNSNSAEMTFKDVNESHWFKPYVEEMFRNGIISGFEDRTFRPNSFITRAQAAKMLAEAFGMTELQTDHPYQDVNTAQWYSDYVGNLYNAKVASSSSENYKPNDDITRAQLVVYIARSIHWIEKMDYQDAVKNTAELRNLLRTELYKAQNTLFDAKRSSGTGIYPAEFITKLESVVEETRGLLEQRVLTPVEVEDQIRLLQETLTALQANKIIDVVPYTIVNGNADRIEVDFLTVGDDGVYEATGKSEDVRGILSQDGKKFVVTFSRNERGPLHFDFIIQGKSVQAIFTWENNQWNIQTKPENQFARITIDDGYHQRVNEIQAKWEELKPTFNGPMMKMEGSTSVPFEVGAVHEGALIDALNMTNFVRFLSYLPSDIIINESFNTDAQFASLVNAVNGNLSHYPEKPEGMAEPMYELGSGGAGTSNLSYGRNTIKDSIQYGYMPDSSGNNRESVGHRRWILSPNLKEVGFGLTIDRNGTATSAMKVISSDMWKESVAYDTITWPSQTAFPTDFMTAKTPWSISVNPSIYDVHKTEEVTVHLTRKNDGNIWTFDQQQSRGYFTISKENYGYLPYTIIFQPADIDQYHAGDQYEIEVENLYKRNGEKTSLRFSTTFFEL